MTAAAAAATVIVAPTSAAEIRKRYARQRRVLGKRERESVIRPGSSPNSLSACEQGPVWRCLPKKRRGAFIKWRERKVVWTVFGGEVFNNYSGEGYRTRMMVSWLGAICVREWKHLRVSLRDV